MWTSKTSQETRAGADALFEIFRDVSSWKDWNPGVERMELHGPFATGTTTTMWMPGEDEPLDARLIWVEAPRGFEDETEVPCAGVVVRVRHGLEPLPGGGTRVTFSTSIDGPEADKAGEEIGPMVTADFPQVIAALIARAEAMEGRR